jgi:hypothetical protein
MHVASVHVRFQRDVYHGEILTKKPAVRSQHLRSQFGIEGPNGFLELLVFLLQRLSNFVCLPTEEEGEIG